MRGLKFEKVSHRLGQRQVVTDFSLDIEPGDFACLLGHSGSGKTTSLRLAAGLEQVQQGQIYLGDLLVGAADTHIQPEHRDIGMVFQDYALFPHLTVWQNVAFGLDTDSKQQHKAAVDWLQRLDMSNYADVYPHTLSGGEQQRVALARALARHPSIMLMDEPFSGLDVRLKKSIRQQTHALLKQEGASVLMVTHDPEEAVELADKIAVLREGRLLQVGSANQLYRQPANLEIAEIFGNLSLLPASVRQDSAVDTPMGRFAAKMPMADKAIVAIRPEAVQITAPGKGELAAQIRWTRFAGPTGTAMVCIGDDAAHVEARIDQNLPYAAGDAVSVAIDHSHVFVFPDE